MTSTYTDGKQTVVVKNSKAYHYNKAGGCIGVTRFENRREFIDQLYRAGFTRDEQDYQDSLK